MSDMERVMRIRLGIFDHDAFTFWRAPPKVRFRGEHFIHHQDRLSTPLIRGEDGALHPASWEEAIDKAARGLLGVAERHGPDALGFVSSSRCTGEENYLLQNNNEFRKLPQKKLHHKMKRLQSLIPMHLSTPLRVTILDCLNTF